MFLNWEGELNDKIRGVWYNMNERKISNGYAFGFIGEDSFKPDLDPKNWIDLYIDKG